MAYVDKNLTCRDCSAPFVFSAGQQEFFAEKGFENEPSRCKACQTAKKQAAGDGGGWGGGGGGYGGGGQAAFSCLLPSPSLMPIGSQGGAHRTLRAVGQGEDQWVGRQEWLNT